MADEQKPNPWKPLRASWAELSDAQRAELAELVKTLPEGWEASYRFSYETERKHWSAEQP